MLKKKSFRSKKRYIKKAIYRERCRKRKYLEERHNIEDEIRNIKIPSEEIKKHVENCPSYLTYDYIIKILSGFFSISAFGIIIYAINFININDYLKTTIQTPLSLLYGSMLSLWFVAGCRITPLLYKSYTKNKVFIFLNKAFSFIFLGTMLFTLIYLLFIPYTDNLAIDINSL